MNKRIKSSHAKSPAVLYNNMTLTGRSGRVSQVKSSNSVVVRCSDNKLEKNLMSFLG